MNVRADLHLHTTASDGRWTPGELVAHVRRAGIDLFAVTDHDALDSLAETAARVRGSGLHFLPGVELSARQNGQLLHLLAYGIDPSDEAFAAFVTRNGDRLAAAGDAAVRLLVRAGYPLSLDEYAHYGWDRRRGGWKSLNFLQDRGLCRDVRSYFDELFGGDLAHPQAEFPPPERVIAAARTAGGVVILAHPGARLCDNLTDRDLDELVEQGVAGLECYSCHHSPEQTRRFLDYCRCRDLLITGGSDCHGGFAGRALGVPPISTGDLRLGDLAERVVT